MSTESTNQNTENTGGIANQINGSASELTNQEFAYAEPDANALYEKHYSQYSLSYALGNADGRYHEDSTSNNTLLHGEHQSFVDEPPHWMSDLMTPGSVEGTPQAMSKDTSTADAGDAVLHQPMITTPTRSFKDENILKGGLKFVCFCAQYCRICTISLKNEEELKKHFREIHADVEPDRYLCEICNKFYSCHIGFKQHLLDHSDNERLLFVEKMSDILLKVDTSAVKMPMNVFPCPVCNKQFVKACLMKLHVDGHHNTEKKFLCSHCGMRFAWVQALSHHEARHKTERLFSCEHCDMKFVTRHDLKSHERKHEKGFKQRYPCEYCGKKFGWKKNLKVHVRIHTGEKPHSCSICNKSFTQSTSLRYHERMHLKDEMQ